MPAASQVILLVEDNRHQQFLYRYLRKLGFGPHAVRIEKSPSGSGSAEQWVRERFVIEVDAYRGRHAQTMLILLVDADIYTVQQRFRQLDQALQGAGISPIDRNNEAILRLVPRRNIETWILRLNDVLVDEETDYKRTREDWSGLIPIAIDTLYRWTRPNAVIPGSCIESLATGIRDLQRLEA